MAITSLDNRRWRAGCLVTALFCAIAVPAFAQSPFGAIEGVVRDESGAVLPGVAVEIASPALIEGSRATVTEATGNYRFLRLPVGRYMVKFSLPGFRPVAREDIVINSEFTATINAELAVGALEETLTVTGESPLVDVRTTLGQTVVTSEVMNAIPSSRNTFDMAKFVLGASTSSPDVGGSSSFIAPSMKVHGSRDGAFYIDGLPGNGNSGSGNSPSFYGGIGAKEETDYQTTAIPAWMPYGGITVNAVTKSGGNRYSGEMFGNTQIAQSTNLDEKLRSAGVAATSGATSAYDVDASLGGPIKRDRAWFFGAARVYSFSGLVGNSFLLDGRQLYDFVRRWDWFWKVSTAINKTNKLVVQASGDTLLRPYRRGGANFVMLEANTYNYYRPNAFPSATWSGTHGNSWIYELQLAHWIRSAPLAYRPEVGPNDVPRLDIVTSVLWGAPVDVRDHYQFGTIANGSITKVGNWFGSHEVRSGVQVNWGAYKNQWNWHGDIILRFRNGAPDSVDLANSPAYNDNRIKNTGLYIQDSWRIGRRLTINAGVRYDQFHGWMPAQSSPAGTWVPARQYPATDVQTWRDVTPRLGVAYDLDGSARTVLKGSFSQYIANEAVGIVESVNPSSLDSSNRCAWTDLNGDLYAQANEISRCTGWSGGVSTRIDPDLRRSYSNEYSAGVQRQLSANFAGSVMYYRRENRDLRGTINRAVPYASYIPVVISNPLNNQPLTIYNQNPSTVGLQDNVLTNSPKLDSIYNGIEFTIQRRFSPDAYVNAGYHYGKDLGRITTGELNDPNADIYADGAVGNDEPHQLKVSAAFLLPWRITASGFFQAYTGHPKVRSLSVGRALVPTLTRATQTVRLERNDENRYPSVNLLDFRLGRRFRVRDLRLEAFADVFNVMNTNTILTEVTTIGSNLGRVSDTVRPRIVRIGAKFAF